MPDNVASVLYGKLSSLFIREAVCACREVTVSIAPIVEVLVQVTHQIGAPPLGVPQGLKRFAILVF